MKRIQVIVFMILTKINSLRCLQTEPLLFEGQVFEFMLKLLSHAEEWAVMQTWHPPLLPFTGSSRPPRPRGPALMSPALRDYADSCWSQNLNSSLRPDSRFGGLMRKNVRNSREIWSQICCVNWRHYRGRINQGEETKELHEKWIIQFAFCHLNWMN